MFEKVFLHGLETGSFTLIGIFALGLAVYIYKTLLAGIIDIKKAKIESILLFEKSFNEDYSHSGKDRLLIEQSIKSIFGSSMSYDDILVLVKYRSPSLAIRQFIRGREFIKLNRTRTSYTFKKDYLAFAIFGYKLYLRYITNLFLYVAFAFPGIRLLSVSIDVAPSGNEPIAFDIIILGTLCLLASIVFLLRFINFIEAKSLIEGKKS